MKIDKRKICNESLQTRGKNLAIKASKRRLVVKDGIRKKL